MDKDRNEAMDIINDLTIEQLHQYFNDTHYLRECMADQFDGEQVSLEYLQNLISV